MRKSSPASGLLTRLSRWLRERARRRRYQIIATRLPVADREAFMLDLGGGAASFFASLSPSPQQVVLVDVDTDAAAAARRRIPGLKVVVADGCRLPFATDSIRVTVCNSVIEHVTDGEALAHEIERVSRSYFVQTPNGKFPLETHSFVPIPFYRWLSAVGLGQTACRIFGANFQYVDSVRYLDETRLTQLFPRATVTRERVWGLTKSFYVIATSR